MLFISIHPGIAQEALRNSLKEQAIAKARSQQSRNPEMQPYTVKVSDYRLLVQPALGVLWKDNINISNEHPLEDFVLQSAVRLYSTYPVTLDNLLTIDLGIGYDFYLQHNDYSGFRLKSGSEISWDLCVKDISFDFHDQFQLTQDAAGNSAIAENGSYGVFENLAGLTAQWDLQDMVLMAGYDHLNYVNSSSSNYGYTDRSSELVVVRSGLQVHPRFSIGVEGTAALTRYEQTVLNDNNGFSMGTFFEWNPSSFIQVTPRFGCVLYQFKPTSQVIPAQDMDTWYAELTLNHHVTTLLSYSFSAGRELRPGLESDATEIFYIRPGLNWRLRHNLSFTTYLSYEQGKQVLVTLGPGVSENYDWWGAGMALTWSYLSNLSISWNYRLTQRSSNLFQREYVQNQLGLLLTFGFQ